MANCASYGLEKQLSSFYLFWKINRTEF
jgi:hypothetical protein